MDGNRKISPCIGSHRQIFNSRGKAQYEEQQLAAVGFEETVPLAEPPQAMWQETANTMQTAPSITPAEAMAEITQSDIETALLQWNGDEDSKARMLAYMKEHSRERGTAEWLKNEYGGNHSALTVTKGDLSLEMPWAKVQRHIGQLVAQGAFLLKASLSALSLKLVQAIPQSLPWKCTAPKQQTSLR